jgi:iron complex outermembrane receptor protein
MLVGIMNKLTIFTLLLFLQTYAADLLDLNLEDLTQISVVNTTASLTATTGKDIPASVTIITEQDILESGARNLDELLDIYVPSFAYMYKVYGSQMGFRGIISDRNNKILLLVNGRVMNIKTSDGGAITERWFSMLGDIKKITVITGPGSPIYGPGAIAGVINIETFSAADKNGLEISGKIGAGEDFAMAEISYGGKIFDDANLYLYYGLDKYSGAKEDSAPLKFAFDYSGKHWWNSDIKAPADEQYPYKTTNDNAALNHKLRHKAYLQIDAGALLFWARFTGSSLENPTGQKMFQWLSTKNAYKYQNTGTRNQQITLFTQYKQKLPSDFSIDYDLSYQRSDLYSNYGGNDISLGGKAWGEDNIIGRITAHYNFNETNIFAFGGEYNYNWYGRASSIGFGEYSRINEELNNTRWTTSVLSFFGEYQKRFTDSLTMFAGIRADKHNYLKWIYSPRISFIYSLDSDDIFKLNWNRSNRYSDEADLYIDYQSSYTQNSVEEIDSFEFIYTKYFDNLTAGVSAFYNEHEAIAYDNTLKKTLNLGKVYSYGGEFQLNYQTPKLLVNLSHSYTKLKKFNLNDPEKILMQNISAMPYGYGDNFSNWNNHITKLRLNYKLAKTLTWINSLRIFWGLPGAKEMSDYNKDLVHTEYSAYALPYYDDGHTRAFEESIYYNTSLLWNIDRQLSLGVYGYNLLGLFDKDMNKRNFYQYTSQYRDMAPSFAIGIKYKLYQEKR